MTKTFKIKGTFGECGGRNVTAEMNEPFAGWRLLWHLMGNSDKIECQDCGANWK